MRLMAAVLALLISFSMGLGQTTAQGSSASSTEQELIRIAQALYDAIPVGDKSVWEKYVADDCIYTDENWHILTKKDLVDSLSPLPKGYSGSIRMANVQARINGDAAVLSYRALEEEYVFGQKLSPTYLVTDTYFKRNGVWQMAASQVIVLPSERKAVALNPRSVKAITGQYELTPGVNYTIMLEGVDTPAPLKGEDSWVACQSNL
jgi:hypothetical protein